MGQLVTLAQLLIMAQGINTNSPPIYRFPKQTNSYIIHDRATTLLPYPPSFLASLIPEKIRAPKHLPARTTILDHTTFSFNADMDMMKGESIKNLIKNGTPCSSILKHTSRVFVALGSLAKRKSWSCRTSNSTRICERKKNKARQIAPAGYFAVYVGPEKQRFVVKTEFSNHPLFKLLLEDAALEYGYKNDGPLLLPCDVDLFSNVLAEMEGNIHEDMISPKSWSSIQIFLGPARARHSDFRMNEGCGGGYRLLN